MADEIAKVNHFIIDVRVRPFLTIRWSPTGNIHVLKKSNNIEKLLSSERILLSVITGSEMQKASQLCFLGLSLDFLKIPFHLFRSALQKTTQLGGVLPLNDFNISLGCYRALHYFSGTTKIYSHDRKQTITIECVDGYVINSGYVETARLHSDALLNCSTEGQERHRWG